MCGLLGMLTAHHNAVDFVPAIERALPCMRHRGPDEAGSWHDTDAVFGFNRLSIIDIAHSHQPLQWGPEGEPDRYAMTFNGEIYNYVELRKELQDLGYTFNTSGDGEPILVGYHHWGKDVVKHLRGMFGIAIWDTKEKQLFLARDPFGIKPLYYATTDKGTVFASEKKCILEMAPELGLDLSVDYRAVEHYVDLQYVPEPESLHTHIRRLESGCIGTVTQEGVVKQERYFKPQFNVRGVVKGEEQVLFDRIARALEDSVDKHMDRSCPAASIQRLLRRWQSVTTRIFSPSPPVLSARATPKLMWRRNPQQPSEWNTSSRLSLPRNTPMLSPRLCGTWMIQWRTPRWFRSTLWLRKPGSTSK